MLTADLKHIDPLTGKESNLIVGDFYRFYDKKIRKLVLYEFLGEFSRIIEVPEKTGFFLLSGEKNQFFVKHFDQEKYEEAMKNAQKPKISKSNNNLLNCEIKVTDDVLKIMVKKMLEGMTSDDFKALFDNVTVCNNMKGAIFGDNELSWKRFSEMVRKLGCTYRLEVKHGDKIISNTEE